MTTKNPGQLFEQYGPQECLTVASLIKGASDLLNLPGAVVADLITIIPIAKWAEVKDVKDALKLLVSENARYIIETLDEAGGGEDVPAIKVTCLLETAQYIKEEAQSRHREAFLHGLQPGEGSIFH